MVTMYRIAGLACAASITVFALVFQSDHAPLNGSGYAMKRTLAQSNQYQSSPQQPADGAPGDVWGLGRSNRPL